MPSTFQFEPYRSDAPRTIADIMLRSGDQQAAALRASGEVKARAAAQIGQDAAGTIGGIIQERRDAPIRALQIHNLQNQTTEGDLQIQAHRRAMLGPQVLAAAIQQYGDNPEKVGKFLVANGFNDVAEGYAKTQDLFTKLKEGTIKTQTEADQFEGEVLDNISHLPAEQRQGAWSSALGRFKGRGIDTSSLSPIWDDAQAAEQIASTKKPSADYTLAPGAVRVSGATNQPMATAGPRPGDLKDLPPTPTDAARYLTQADAIVPPTDMGNAALRQATITRIQNARTNADAQKALEDAQNQIGQVNVARQKAPIQISVATGTQTAKDTAAAAGVTQDAIDKAAVKYHQTGEMSGMGMGNAVLRRQIMNREAELYPGGSLAGNAAAYKANASALKNITGTLSTLSAFETTAGKNLDQFLALAEKIPDTGVPWINTPLRLLNDKAVGSVNQAAFAAARDVALREIARVTNDPKLSGALTDSARAEVSSFSPKNATFAQIKKVAAVLKQDMANVHSGLEEQQADLQRKVGDSGGSTPAAAGGKIRARDPQGQLHEAAAGTPLPAGWKAEP